MTTLRVETAPPLHRIRLDRPERHNPLGPRCCGELRAALRAYAADAGARCALLEASGPVFSAGDLVPLDEAGAEPRATLAEVIADLDALDKPVVAVVAGAALSGGVALAAACHLIVASEDATFHLPDAAAGRFPLVACHVLGRAAGPRLALDLALTGRKLPAREAEFAGLVARVAFAGEAESTALTLARAIAAASPTAIAAGLRGLRAARAAAPADRLALLAAEEQRLTSTPDASEGLAALLSGREPPWKR
jgi:enoyl-CoA hydratase/carnithine racemase